MDDSTGTVSRGLKGVQTLIRTSCWGTCGLPQYSCASLSATAAEWMEPTAPWRSHP